MSGTNAGRIPNQLPRDLLNLLSEREALQLVESETNRPDLVRDWESELIDIERQVLDAYDRAVERWREHYTDIVQRTAN